MDKSNHAGYPRKPARGSIYRYLHRSADFCGKQDLARALGLSMPTVYRNVNELMDMGLVAYSGQRRATGGRSASGLAVVPRVRLAVGVSIPGILSADKRQLLFAPDRQGRQIRPCVCKGGLRHPGGGAF